MDRCSCWGKASRNLTSLSLLLLRQNKSNMNLTLYWDAVPKFKQNEKSLAYKWQTGQPSNNLQQRLNITVPKTINKKWKEGLTNRLKTVKFVSGTTCVAMVQGQRYEMNVKTLEKFVNNLANLILRTRHNYKDRFGRSRESLLNSL